MLLRCAAAARAGDRCRQGCAQLSAPARSRPSARGAAGSSSPRRALRDGRITLAGAGPSGSPWSTEGWSWMQVPRAGLEAAPSALCILDALLRRRAFFLFNISPLNLRWTMESFQHSEYNELVSAALELVSRLKTRPAGSTLGPGSSTKNNGKARRGAGGEAGSSPLRQRCIWGCSKLSGSPPREDHSFQTFLLTLRLVPSLPFIAFSGGGFCMPNGMLEKALLPGWAPDAMQLIHFYSREQVSRASQAASLKTTLFIWPQALEESEGAGLITFPWSAVSGNNPDWKSHMPRQLH